MTETEPNKTSSERTEGSRQTVSRGEHSDQVRLVRHNSSAGLGGRGAGGELPPREEEDPGGGGAEQGGRREEVICQTQ